MLGPEGGAGMSRDEASEVVGWRLEKDVLAAVMARLKHLAENGHQESLTSVISAGLEAAVRGREG